MRRILFDQTKSGTGIRKKETWQYGWLVGLVMVRVFSTRLHHRPIHNHSTTLSSPSLLAWTKFQLSILVVFNLTLFFFTIKKILLLSPFRSQFYTIIILWKLTFCLLIAYKLAINYYEYWVSFRKKEKTTNIGLYEILIEAIRIHD